MMKLRESIQKPIFS